MALICVAMSSAALAACVASDSTSLAPRRRPSRLPGARRLDRRVERGQVGLRRFILNEFRHLADALRRAR
jgi:hypothetical protein